MEQVIQRMNKNYSKLWNSKSKQCILCVYQCMLEQWELDFFFTF